MSSPSDLHDMFANVVGAILLNTETPEQQAVRILTMAGEFAEAMSAVGGDENIASILMHVSRDEDIDLSAHPEVFAKLSMHAEF